MLNRLGSTALYEPSTQEPLVFLLWQPPAAPPPSFPFAETWSDSGPAVHVGYFVFLGASAGADAALELEQKLRQQLPPPAAGGFGWAVFQPQASFQLIGVVEIVLDSSGRPIVAADAPLQLPPGIMPFTFPGKCRVTATWQEGGGFVLTFPPPATGSTAVGVRVAVLGARCGCISALTALASPVVGEASVKALATLSLDPLAVFDPARTRLTPTGEFFVLRAIGGGYSFLPVPSA